MRNILSFILVLVSFNAFSQRNCASEQYQAELEKSWRYQAEKMLRNSRGLFVSPVELRDSLGNCLGYEIKTTVHYTNVSDTACAALNAQKNIAILNKGLVLQDTNFGAWNAFKSRFDIVPIESCLKFRLDSVVFHKDFKSYRPEFKETFNVYVGQISNGILGYSSLGGFYGDGVVISTKYFDLEGCLNLGSAEPYGLGKTLLHECGHHFNLFHIWRDSCGNDDLIQDTPNQANPNYGCPLNAFSCNSYDMSINYMDYVDDRCMFLFSPQQIKRMESYVSFNLQDVLEFNPFTSDSIFIDSTDVLNPIDTSSQDSVINPVDTVITPPIDTIQISNPTDEVTINISINWRTMIYVGVVLLLGLFGYFVFMKKR